MSALRGADIDQLGVLGRSFVQEAGQVEDLAARVSGLLGATNWTGPGADRFREQWNGEFVPSLNALREALTVASQSLVERQQAIEAATA